MPIKRVLAATDGSVEGEHAVVLSRMLTRRARAELRLLTVSTAELALAAGETSRPAATWAAGVPAIEIVHRAQAIRADLLVLGRRPRVREAPLPFGTTSEAVVRRRSGATLLVPRTVRAFHRILIALDGTARGLGILEDAADFVAATSAEASVVLVLSERDSCELDSQCEEDPRAVRAREALASHPSLVDCKVTVRCGPAVHEILDLLRQTGADVLMLGVRRGGPAGDMGSGHVGRDLLRMAPGAILTVPI